MYPAKINFEIDFCWLEIYFVELDFSNLIFQKSSTDQQEECLAPGASEIYPEKCKLLSNINAGDC